MDRFSCLLPVVAFCAVAQAFAADPPTSPPPTAAQPTRIVLEDKTLTNDEIAKLFAEGYKPSTHNGEVVYCRKETVTGSRFKQMNCKTADQIKQLTQDSKDFLAKKQIPGGNSPGH
jgi:hypothetical protein